MMSKELCKKLEPIEEEFDCELMTFDEALEFYKSDIEIYKSSINTAIQINSQLNDNPEYLAGIKEGLRQGLEAVEIIFGGRVEEGF